MRKAGALVWRRDPSGRRAVPLALLTFALALGRPAEALAQQWEMSAQVGGGTGLEGSSPHDGVEWRRARTRVVLGLDFESDEKAYPAFGFRGFVEAERQATVGLGAHYSRWLTPSVGLFAGLRGVVAPETLIGGGGGATFVIPFGHVVGLFIEPEIAALPLGSDLPGDEIVVWTLLSLGLRVNL